MKTATIPPLGSKLSPSGSLAITDNELASLIVRPPWSKSDQEIFFQSFYLERNTTDEFQRIANALPTKVYMLFSALITTHS